MPSPCQHSASIHVCDRFLQATACPHPAHRHLCDHAQPAQPTKQISTACTSRTLFGTIDATSYDWLEAPATPSSEAFARIAGTERLNAGSVTALYADSGNMHTFVARCPSAVFDILIPGYCNGAPFIIHHLHQEALMCVRGHSCVLRVRNELDLFALRRCFVRVRMCQLCPLAVCTGWRSTSRIWCSSFVWRHAAACSLVNLLLCVHLTSCEIPKRPQSEVDRPPLLACGHRSWPFPCRARLHVLRRCLK